jgi:hypothetical protein
MNTFLRTLILLATIVWLGGLLFFPIVAAITFTTLVPDTHAAGTIVGACLRVLDKEGLACGVVLMLLLFAGRVRGLYTRSIFPAIVTVVVMLALTSITHYVIIPRMEKYRMAAGGVIDAVPKDDPNRAAFDQLHQTSEKVEEGVMIAGLLFVVLLARAESGTIKPS